MIPPSPEGDLGQLWRTVALGLEEGVIVFDPAGRLVTGNPAAERLLGLSAARQRGQGLTDPRWDVVDEDGQALGFEHYPAYRCLRSGRTETALLGVGSATGERRWLQVKAQPIRAAGVLTHVAVTYSDVTAQREAQARLGREAHFRRTLLEVVTASLAEHLDARFYGRLLEGAVQAIPGAQAASLLLRAGEHYAFVAAVGYDLSVLQRVYLLPEELFRGDDGLSPLLVYGFDNREIAPERRQVIDGAGRAAEIKVCLSLPVIFQGEPVAYLSLDNFTSAGAFGDEALEMGRIFAQQTAALWQRFMLEAELRHLAHHDPLTGLPNRGLLGDRLRQALARRKAGPLAVLFVDLDDFKGVNDTLGHGVGDALLCEAAARLSSVVREGDTLARWGGDEFVLLTELEHTQDAAAVAEKLLAVFARPFEIGGRELTVTASVGIATDLDTAGFGDELVRHADAALYRAKAAGKNTHRSFAAKPP